MVTLLSHAGNSNDECHTRSAVMAITAESLYTNSVLKLGALRFGELRN
jgi:hypothetical protein